MSFEYLDFRILEEKDHTLVWNLMLEEYFTREPVCAVSNFSPDETKMYVGDFVNDGLWQHASLGAFDKQSHKLVAIQINILGKKPRKYLDYDENGYPMHVRQAIGIMDHIAGDTSDIIGTTDYMNFIVLCCRKSYCNRGIATELYKRSEEIARNEGCKKMYTIATNCYTRKITDKFGYTVINEMNYEDYVDPFTGNKIFNNTAKPHSNIALVVKIL
ncbi:uncharacterized protein LOC120341834 isoform X1 [Styela clava]